MDIPDIERVVQFAVPTSLLVLSQRAGRAGRSGRHALAILLAEPSVFQVVEKGKKPDTSRAIKFEPDEDEDLDLDDDFDLDDDLGQIERKKNMEAGLRAWCLADGCRVEVSDEYFNNPPRSTGMSILMSSSAAHQCSRHSAIRIPVLR